ncbi:uncharacterized protein LOC142612126 [Castanea sativa]|uniref:uncharacterized protein LOC142612126 n=1 Tax=Castanea sativa TaxID=21020 RepID=UPI003F64C588
MVRSSGWLPHPPLFKPDVDASMKVGDLIDQRTMQWKKRVIQDTFLQSTQEEVLRIQLRNTRDRDQIYWKENKVCQFTVRSAYQVARRMNQVDEAEHSRARVDKRLWNKLWTLNIPPKAEETVSHALWECPMARNVWAMVRGKLQKCGARIQTFHLLARQLMEKLMREEQELWAMVAWSIWNARNRFYFEDTQNQPSDILRGATTLLQDYHRWNGQLAHH